MAALRQKTRPVKPNPSPAPDKDSRPSTEPSSKTGPRYRPFRGLKVDRHTATTAHACTLYPWGVHSGTSVGAYLGWDRLGAGSAFFFDPFESYEAMSTTNATNTNMLVIGQPGTGKSGLMKSMLLRLVAVYGRERFLAIVDVKGEYTGLAETLGMPVVKLSPGGDVRVNPLEIRGTDDNRVLRQVTMVTALLTTILSRGLSPVEDAALWAAIAGFTVGEPTLSDLVLLIADPTPAMAAAARRDRAQLQAELTEVALTLEKLLDRSLGGMFDGKSTVSIDPQGQGVVIDISAVQHLEEALPVVMVAATAWLQEIITTTQAKTVQLLDECWRMVAYEGTARYLQSCWKLGRTFGVANIAVLHKPADLAAQSDDGSAVGKIAKGLVADTAVRVTFAQSEEELAISQKLLGLSDKEAAEVKDLYRGESLWKIGSHVVSLTNVIADHETELINTDQAIIDDDLHQDRVSIAAPPRTTKV